MTARPRAILFDLDDTLLDRASALQRYAGKLHDDFGALLPSETAETIHEALKAVDDFGSLRQAEALVRALPWREPPAADVLFKHWGDQFGRMATFFPDARNVLAELSDRGIVLGLVTNGSATLQRAKIAALDLDQFMSTIVISGEVGVAKPEPAIFALALTNLGCEASESWFVGDHPELDVRGAECAGLRAFWVRTGRMVPSEEKPERALSHLSELLDCIGS